MQFDEFFTEQDDIDPWGVPATLRTDLLNMLRAGPLLEDDDLGTAVALTRLVYRELEAFGTDSSNRLNDAEIELAQRALKATLERHGITLDLPWRDFSGFYSYWVRNEAKGSWQARRDILTGFFEPVREELDRLEDARFRAVLAQPVSPRHDTG